MGASVEFFSLRRALVAVAASVLIAFALNQSRAPEKAPATTIRPATPEQKLVDWLRARGGWVGFEIRSEEGRERGGFAKQDFNTGDVVAMIPATACIKLKNTGFAAEHAHELAQRLQNSSFYHEFAPYLETLPGRNQTLTSELFTEAHLRTLQSPELEKLVHREKMVSDGIYFGLYKPEEYAAIPQLLGGIEAVTLQDFRHLASLISSRDFAWHTGADDEAPTDYLVPAADMLNTDADRLNVEQSNDGEKFYLTATRPIRRGEELYNHYLPGLDHRNDFSLSGYGFIRKLAKPLLPATDLPTFNADAPYEPTPADDTAFYGPHGAYNTLAELARLRALLAESPTTEAEDVALLAGGQLGDWRDRVLVEFRVERKKALRAAIQAVEQQLAGDKA